MRRRRIIVTFVVILASALSVGAAIPQDSCTDRLPHVLNVGVPGVSSTADLTRSDIREQLQRHLAVVYERSGARCSGTQSIQINIAAGNEYQMLDWIGQGLIDAAIVPDMGLFLLTRDGAGVYEIDPGLTEGQTILPALPARPRARRRHPAAPGGWIEESDALTHYRQFLDEVWRKASESNVSMKHELVLSTHLSSTGFVAPVAIAAEEFASRMKSTRATGKSDVATRVWQTFFDSTRFAIDCDSIDNCFEATAAGDRTVGHAPRENTVAILFPGENTLRLEAAAHWGGGAVFREHLLITASAAERVFEITEPQPAGMFRPVTSTLPSSLVALLADPPPSMFQSILDSEPHFGVRTYGFTVDEVFRLLRQEQRSSGETNMALVLPGGGVKAAYQSRVIDELYGRRYLRNEYVPSDDASTLPVRSIIGTSGGALLGYFVSQLGESGPFDLTNALWNSKGARVKSTDIFGWTDLLRYISIVASFAVFCLILTLVSSTHRSRFYRTPRRRPEWRWQLTLAIVPLFAFAPLLIRFAGGDGVGEHVPEIEGIFYAIMVVIVMGADQCLVRDGEIRREDAPRKRDHRLMLAAGALLLAMPLMQTALPSRLHAWLQHPVTFRVAFTWLSVLVIGGGLVLLHVQNRLGSLKRRFMEIASALLLVMILGATGLMDRVDLPHVAAGLALIFVGILAYWYARANRRMSGVTWVATFATTFLIARLCWPQQSDAAAGPFDFLTATSLDVSTGAFFVSIGLILLLFGGASLVYQNRSYAFQNAQEFRLGLAILLLHALMAFGLIVAVSVFSPALVTPLELTGAFWWFLIAFSGLLALVIIGVAATKRFRHLYNGVAYLCEEHPNAAFVTRRYSRMCMVAIFGVVWWNVVLAPALYGNRTARNYLDTAIRQFNEKRGGANPTGFQPTAQFVTPANLLEKDGTRYFMFLPAGGDCPSIPARPASGAKWWVYDTGTSSELRQRGRTCAGVRSLPLPAPGDPARSQRFVHSVVFASGSPFPIFPAHRLDIAGEKPQAYIDGGYSNDVPVDAARTLEAKQVLIVQSNPSLESSQDKQGILQRALLKIPGRLIVNLRRLPGYLFERSQQVDRLSRRDLFVISLSPSPVPIDACSRGDVRSWPPLFDFRTSTVDMLLCTANDDLGRRIGIVESWGRPQFRLNAQVDPVRVATRSMPADRR